MDGLSDFLGDVQKNQQASGHFLGLLHILIGRSIQSADGKVISSGITWRDAANLLKHLRWDIEAVRDFGLDPATLPPRDRQRFWYQAIALAEVASAKAVQSGNTLAPILKKAGYVIGPAPGAK